MAAILSSRGTPFAFIEGGNTSYKAWYSDMAGFGLGLIVLVGSLLWLALLVVTGFSVLAVSAGLLTAVCVLGRTDHLGM